MLDIKQLFSFNPLSKEEKLQQRKIKDLQEASEEAVLAARNCYNSDNFTIYKKKAEQATEILLKMLLELSPLREGVQDYAFKASAIITELYAVRKLLSDVEKTAKIGEVKK